MMRRGKRFAFWRRKQQKLALEKPRRRGWLRRLLGWLNPLRWLRLAGRLIPFAWLRRMGRRAVSFLARVNPFRSLWFRLVGAFVAVILIMLFSVLNVLNEVTAREFSQYVEARNEYLRSVIPTVVPPTAVPPHTAEQPAIAWPTEEAWELPPEIELAPDVELPPGIVIAPDIPLPTATPIPGETAGDVETQVIVERPAPIVIEQVLTFDSPEAQTLTFLRDVRERAQTAVFIASIAAVILGTLLFRQITRPLSRIRAASQALAGGDLAARVPVHSRDELGKVANAFNQMAVELQKQDQLRQQMVADVAHELRTPVTVMQSNLEAMLDGLLTPSDAELRELHDEVRRLSRMIDDLRLLSLADAGQLTLRQEPLNVAELVMDVVGRMAPLAQAQGVALEADVPRLKLAVNGDADRLQQALGNLIDNGVRHTPAGGRVRVTAVRENSLVHVTVADTGPGIPAADLPFIFERFWRGDRARSRHGGGSGLGLAIVQQIVSLHGGRVQVASPPGAGAIFTVSLPRRE